MAPGIFLCITLALVATLRPERQVTRALSSDSILRIKVSFGSEAVVKNGLSATRTGHFSSGTLPKPITRLRVHVAALMPLSGKVETPLAGRP